MKDLDDAIERYYKNVSSNDSDDGQEIKDVLDEMLLLNEVDVPINFNISNMIEEVQSKKEEEELNRKNFMFFIFASIFCGIMSYCSIKFALWQVFLYEFVLLIVLSAIVIISSNIKEKKTI